MKESAVIEAFAGSALPGCASWESVVDVKLLSLAFSRQSAAPDCAH